MSLLAVGSVALDAVETPSGLREEILGGAAVYFAACASFFGPVRLVAVAGDDFPEEHCRYLASRRIDLSGLTRRPGKTFRWKGRYGADLNSCETLYTQLNVFAEFDPQLAESHRDSEYVFLGNIDPDLQRSVLDQIRSPRFVAADTMNYWIESKNDSLREMLKRIDLLFVNEAEARQLARERNVMEAARRILGLGPRALVVKRGEYGALVFTGDGVFAVPAYPLAAVVDPTGAGDSFAGGFMGYVARSGQVTPAAMRRATALGTVLASFTVEQFSLDRLRTLAPVEIRKRYEELTELTRFEDLEAGLLTEVSPS